MKVREVNPGSVYPMPNGYWAYCYRVNGGLTKVESEKYLSASIAKQAMREKVAHERKRHGLES